MKYKIIFLDVDGTLVPYEYNALPSDKVAHAVRLAQDKCTVCIVTGRSYGFTKPVLEKLQITSGYVVVNNGSAIIDLVDESVVHTQPMDNSDVQEIFTICKEEEMIFSVKDTPFDTSHGLDLDEYTNPKIPENTFMILMEEIYSNEKIDHLLKRLAHLTTINAYKTTHKDPTKFGVNITHVNATKLFGVQFLLHKLHLNREDSIAAGDSYNDFPLLMASGLKVAMGNAIEDLKDIADYVAPPVTDDGVADVIERFILSDSS
jgi:Cof subfamily protein (haloacid dehalogenase superfamily)